MGNELIILDVRKGDFDLDLQTEHRWQRQAESSLIKALRTTANFAKEYRNKRNGNKSYLQAVHDAIFVTAPRGAGKTVFLRNAGNAWQSVEKTDKNAPKLHFCREIDPTLLVNKDNFANVVIAHFYNEVEARLKPGAAQSVKQGDKFYHALSLLADSLGQAEYKGDELSGIDRIISYRSGIQLEQHFHDFVEQCIAILGVDAIVLPIDDVDMALGKAFEVLDVLRRLLACPFVIPLVSGDRELYTPIVYEHFLYGGDPQKRTKLLENDQAHLLSSAFLTKLFPVQFRIRLQTLDEILPAMRVGDGTNQLFASTYLENLNTLFCPIVNGQEKSRNWPEPTSARDMQQLCTQFPPKWLEAQFTEKSPEFWNEYLSLAEAKYHGAGYLVAKAEQHLKSLQAFHRVEFPLRELAIFNVTEQAKPTLGEWKGKKFHSEMIAAHNALRADKSQLNFLVVLEERPYVLRSMPPIEFHVPALAISRANLAQKSPTPPATETTPPQIVAGAETATAPATADGFTRQVQNEMLLRIYTHHAYYGSSLKTNTQIFFGRAFELLATSLLLARKVEPKAERIKFWVDLLGKLIITPPFHSIYVLAPTKTHVTDDEPEDTDDQPIVNQLQYEQLRPFAEQIIEWENAFSSALIWAQEQGLTHLLSCVFNKVFTQLHVMRAEAGKIFKNDYLTHTAKRFEYLVINAFATFMKTGAVVLQNIAITENTATIQDAKEFARKDPSFRGNVIPFVGARPEKPCSDSTWTTLPVADDSNAGQQVENIFLLRAIWAHPLFDLVNDEPMYPLGKSPTRHPESLSGTVSPTIEQDTPAATISPDEQWLLSKLIPTFKKIENLSQDDALIHLNNIRVQCQNKGGDADMIFKNGNGSSKYAALKHKAGKG
jgi:hypothetical protein